MTTTDLFQAGRLEETIGAVSAEMKTNPTDVRRRTFLFELLCFSGDYDRAEKQLALLADQTRNTMFGLYDMFSGGNLSKVTIFALGIMPYISASIILQLLAVVWPYLDKLSKEGELGRRKITQYTRYGTILLSVIQSLGIAIFLEQ